VNGEVEKQRNELSVKVEGRKKQYILYEIVVKQEMGGWGCCARCCY